MSDFVWITWVTLLSLFGSFGEYGLVWIIRSICEFFSTAEVTATGNSRWVIGDEVGGVYWLMTMVLPGFIQFRFPAKLLVVTALGLSILAGRNFDRFREEDVQHLRKMLWGSCLISFVGLLIVALLHSRWGSMMAELRADLYSGPIDSTGAFCDLLRSLAHTLIAGFVFLLLFRLNRKEQDGRSRSRLIRAILILCSIDIAVASSRMIKVIRTSELEKTPTIAQLINVEEQRNDSGDLQPFRFFRVHDWVPKSWEETTSPDRLDDWIVRCRDSLFPKYYMKEKLESFLAPGTLDMFGYDAFTLSAYFPDKNVFVQPRRSMDAWGVKYFIIPNRVILKIGR